MQRSSWIRRFPELTLVALVSFSVVAAAPAAPAEEAANVAGARSAVQETVDEVMGILRDAALSQDDKKERVEAIAFDRFDFYAISRLVLARNWKKFSAEQRDAFQDAFRQHLSVTYRDTLDSFADETITIEGARIEPRGDVTVHTLVRGGSDTTRVDYRMRQRDAGWKGIDVIVEGVSLVQNFRAQAQEIVSSEGPDALIQQLRDKNAPKS